MRRLHAVTPRTLRATLEPDMHHLDFCLRVVRVSASFAIGGTLPIFEYQTYLQHAIGMNETELITALQSKRSRCSCAYE
jgi:hypothetical protein